MKKSTPALAAAMTATALTLFQANAADPDVWNYYPKDASTNYARITDGQWVLRVSGANKTTGALVLGEGYGISNAYVSGVGRLDIGDVVCRDSAAGVDYRITTLTSQSAFEGLSNAVTELTFPRDVKVIPQRTFQRSEIRDVAISSEALVHLGDYAFAYSAALTNIWVDALSLTNIGKGAFAYCSNLVVDVRQVLPQSSIALVGESAFQLCKQLTGRIVLPQIVRVSQNAFADCSGIEGLELSSSALEELGASSFYRLTSLTNAVINAPNLLKIGQTAFAECSNLVAEVSQVVPPSLAVWSGEKHYYKCKKLTGHLLLTNATYVGANAFAECSGITSIALTNPNLESFTREGSFNACTGITNILIGATNSIEVVKATVFGSVAPSVSVTFWGPAPTNAATFSNITGGDAHKAKTYLASFRVSRRQEGWLDASRALTPEELAMPPPEGAFGTVEGVSGSFKKRIWLIHSDSPYDQKATICILQ